MTSNLEQIIRLMKKTGDKFIVNVDGENFVLLPIKEYEKIVAVQDKNRPASELSEEELIEKINDEISQWRLTQTSDEDLEAYFSKNDLENQSEIDDEDQYYLELID